MATAPRAERRLEPIDGGNDIVTTDQAPTRLLLVDDEPSLREPLADYLVRQGFVVRQAADAAKARSALLEETLFRGRPISQTGARFNTGR